MQTHTKLHMQESRLIYQHFRSVESYPTSPERITSERLNSLANSVEDGMQEIDVERQGEDRYEFHVPLDSTTCLRLGGIHTALRPDTIRIDGPGYLIERDRNDRSLIRVRTKRSVAAFTSAGARLDSRPAQKSTDEVADRMREMVDRDRTNMTEEELKQFNEELEGHNERIELELEGGEIVQNPDGTRTLNLKEDWKQVTLKIDTYPRPVVFGRNTVGMGNVRMNGYEIKRDPRFATRYNIKGNLGMNIVQVV